MQLKKIKADFSVCQISDPKDIDYNQTYCFVSKTDEELSLVCETAHVPVHTINRDDGWKAFRIEGVLDFSLIGILSKISSILADHQIGIFAISTYNTDYILVKKENFEKAQNVLQEKGYEIIE